MKIYSYSDNIERFSKAVAMGVLLSLISIMFTAQNTFYVQYNSSVTKLHSIEGRSDWELFIYKLEINSILTLLFFVLGVAICLSILKKKKS
jgi:hypothetical protein